MSTEDRFFITSGNRPDILNDFKLASTSIEDAIDRVTKLQEEGCHSDGKEGGSDGNETGDEKGSSSEGKEASDPQHAKRLDSIVLVGDTENVAPFLHPMM